MERKKISFAAFGNTGTGKSSFLNLLFNSREDFFKVGETTDSFTDKPKSLNIGNLSLWDFPGLNDTKNRDKEFIQEMLRTFQANKFNAIALVYNIATEKLGDFEKYTIDVICKMFPYAYFWKHVILVFTHCDTKQAKRKGRTTRGPEISEKILNEVEKHFPDIKEIVSTLPCYFVNAERDEETREFEKESLEEAKRFVTHIMKIPEIKCNISRKIVMSKKILKNQKRIETNYEYEKDDSFSANLKRFLAHVSAGAATPLAVIPPLAESLGEIHKEISRSGQIEYLVTNEITYDLEVIEYSDGTSKSNPLKETEKKRFISRSEVRRFF